MLLYFVRNAFPEGHRGPSPRVMANLNWDRAKKVGPTDKDEDRRIEAYADKALEGRRRRVVRLARRTELPCGCMVAGRLEYDEFQAAVAEHDCPL